MTVGRFADMSRYAFASTEQDTVPLIDEMAFVRAYLDIEQVRFGPRLRVALPASSDLSGLSVPPLAVQPLVENAVCHGIAKRPDGGTVTVRVHRLDTAFALIVENDTADDESVEATMFREGHALANIRDRIRAVYGRRASLVVSRPRADAVAVAIRIEGAP
jgi:two-component system LytT family sensor kinase